MIEARRAARRRAYLRRVREEAEFHAREAARSHLQTVYIRCDRQLAAARRLAWATVAAQALELDVLALILEFAG